MKIAIHTLGTRGDLQPYLALSRGLVARGHEVLIAAPAQFEKDVAREAVGFSALPAAFLELLEKPEGRAAMAGGRPGFAAGLGLLKSIGPLMRGLMDAEWLAARDFRPAVLLYHPKALAAPVIADHLGVPAILAAPLPGFTATSTYPTPLLPFSSLGPLNRVSHRLMIHAPGLLFGGTLRRWQKATFGVASKVPRPAGTLHAYSPSVLPPDPSWPETVRVSGYWFLDTPGWEPDAALAAYLASGPPPVYVGFGSMPAEDAPRLSETITSAVRQAGCRAVVAGGWSDLAQAVPAAGDMLVIDSAPHDRLFPRMAAVVHHGGAGTTGAGLRAGRPTLVCPVLGDQPFWGRLVARLGAGPQPIARRDLTVDRLAAALVDLTGNVRYRTEAARLAEAIGREDGVATATGFIERIGRQAAGR